MKHNYTKFSAKGVTIIEILCFIALIGTIFALTCPAFQAAYDSTGSILLALLFSGIVFLFVICIIYFILWILMFFIHKFFPSHPDHCDSKKCYLYDCYRVRLGVSDGCFSIIYYKCRCGNEYVCYGCRFFAKVDEDGSLIPYIFNRKYLGWYQDKRIDSEAYNYKIPLNILKLLREESKSVSFVHKDKKSNFLILNTSIDLKRCDGALV